MRKKLFYAERKKYERLNKQQLITLIVLRGLKTLNPNGGVLRNFLSFPILYTVLLIDLFMSLPFLEFELSPIYHMFGLEGSLVIKFGYPTFLLVLHQTLKDEYWKNWIRRSVWVCAAGISAVILFNLSQSILVTGTGILIIVIIAIIRVAILRKNN